MSKTCMTEDLAREAAAKHGLTVAYVSLEAHKDRVLEVGHRHTSNCPSSCYEPRWTTDPLRYARLPRGWLARHFIGPWAQR